MVLSHPTPFGKYLLLDRIAAGGMAEVYRAKTFGAEGFEKLLAIKRILPNMAEDSEFIRMFVDEARIAVRLTHPNVVQIYELGKYNDQYYISMEYVPGTNGREFFTRVQKTLGRLDIPAAAFIIGNVCDGLDYAHRKTDLSGRPLNVVHRDVSPQNVLLSFEGQVKVTDFGIAKAEDRVSDKTQAGVLKGKFSYMAPEQVRGKVIDHRADVFAVGILLYELTTGKRLFKGQGDLATLEMVRSAKVTPPSEIADIPKDLEEIILRALSLNRDERYQWASDLHDDLQRFLIVDRSIYNAKSLRSLMQELYADEIAAEKERMEAYAALPRPAGQEATPAGLSPLHLPKGGEREVFFDPDTDKHNRTVVLASGADDDPLGALTEADGDGDGDAPADATRIDAGPFSWNDPDLLAPDAETLAEDQAAFVPSAALRRKRSGPAAAGTEEASDHEPSISQVAPTALGRKGMLAMVASAAAVLVTIGVLIAVAVDFGGTGTMVVSSVPTQDVELYLDGVLIATRTPYSSHEIPRGEHTLTAKARGYADKAFRFQMGDTPALITIELTPRDERDHALAAAGAQNANAPGASPTTQGSAPAGEGAPGETQATATSGSDTPGSESPQAVGHAHVSAEHETTTAKVTADETAHVSTHVPVAAGAQEASVLVNSNPAGGTVFYRGVERGRTPTTLNGLDPKDKAVIGVTRPGYEMTYKTVTFETGLHQSVVIDLKPKAQPQPAAGGECKGSDGLLSLMAIGAQNCAVTVEGSKIGTAPFFKKSTPSGGRCKVNVSCADGRRYSTTINLPPGEASKLIIRSDMWK